MSEAALSELKLDLEEYEHLHKLASRAKVQEYLLKEVDRLRRDILSLETKTAAKSAAVEGNLATSAASTRQATHTYVENITNYGFDQTSKYMELYLPLENLAEITDDNIEANFTNRSVTVRVHFPHKTSQLQILRLCEDILPADSYFKKKSKHVVVMLKKAEVGKNWTSLTEREKKAKEKKDKPKLDDNEDPSAGLTKLLQNMYEDGDDEMKRTISKAWYESQTKRRGEGDAFPDF